MKLIIALLIVLFIVILIWAAVQGFRNWNNSRHPWELVEDEGLGGRMAWHAVKPGHEPQRLTTWRNPDDLDFAAIWADDLALAESKVTHMNLRGRKQIGA